MSGRVRSLWVPFTIAHAAAVLPFVSQHGARRRCFDASCLVAGAMAPDFEYFLHARMQSNLSHTLMGLVTFDVPVALAIAVVFHGLVRAPLARALPAPLFERFAHFLTETWRPRAHVAVGSALVGAITHLAWDACTHRTGWVVRALPTLERNVLVDGLPAYRLLQHASTAIGLALIALAIARMPRHVVAKVASQFARVAFIALPLAIGGGAAIARVVVEPAGVRIYGHALAAFIAGALVGICAASLLVRRIGQAASTVR